jgi:hypothetical protein
MSEEKYYVYMTNSSGWSAMTVLKTEMEAKSYIKKMINQYDEKIESLDIHVVKGREIIIKKELEVRLLDEKI